MDFGIEGLVNDLRVFYYKESDVKNFLEIDNGVQDLSGFDDFEEKDGGVVNLEICDGVVQKLVVSGFIELEEI